MSEDPRERLEAMLERDKVSKNLPEEGKYIRVIYTFHPLGRKDYIIGRHIPADPIEIPGRLYLVPASKRLVSWKKEYGFIANAKEGNYSRLLTDNDLFFIDMSRPPIFRQRFPNF